MFLDHTQRRSTVCDLETSRMGAPYIYDISRLKVKLLIMQFSPLPFYHAPLRTKYSPQHPTVLPQCERPNFTLHIFTLTLYIYLLCMYVFIYLFIYLFRHKIFTFCILHITCVVLLFVNCVVLLLIVLFCC